MVSTSTIPWLGDTAIKQVVTNNIIIDSTEVKQLMEDGFVEYTLYISMYHEP